MIPAPILLFAYNRPAHLQKTVEALKGNDLARNSTLTVCTDGPKTHADAQAVGQVRRYVHGIDGFASVRVIERQENFGLARSIISGVTTALEEAERVIVLEDDIVTSPHFLRYMNEALELFQDEEKVMHVSGYMPPLDATGLPESVLMRPASCWGWGTWRRAWRHFFKDTEALCRRFDANMIRDFNLDGAYDYWGHVLLNRRGRIDTWAIFWYASIFLRGGLCLHPARSLTDNVGHDGSGSHCQATDMFHIPSLGGAVTNFPKEACESSLALSRLQAYYRSHRLSWHQRMVRKSRHLLDKLRTE